MASLFKPTFTRYVDPEGKRVSRDTPGARKVQGEINEVVRTVHRRGRQIQENTPEP